MVAGGAAGAVPAGGEGGGRGGYGGGGGPNGGDGTEEGTSNPGEEDTRRDVHEKHLKGREWRFNERREGFLPRCGNGRGFLRFQEEGNIILRIRPFGHLHWGLIPDMIL